MNSINGVGANSSIQKISAKPIQKSVSASAPKQVKLTDKVKLSGMGPLLATLKAGGDIRADKVATIKAQIEAGKYETSAKLDAAIDRLIDDLGR